MAALSQLWPTVPIAPLYVDYYRERNRLFYQLIHITMQHLSIEPRDEEPPTRDLPSATPSSNLPSAKNIKVHPSSTGEENASIFFVGTATTIMFVSSLVIH